MNDEWVTSALFDDNVVAELLFRLKQSSSQTARPPPLLPLPIGWGHRQPRSKPKKDLTTTTTRCSPTTPLSWSGGGGAAASPSDGGYDCDYNSNSNSSRPSSDPSRSKGGFTNDPSSVCSSSHTKRSKKKKTFAELKDEEHSLLKQRITLEKELASLHVTLEEQKARSHNLKRIKIDLDLHTSAEVVEVAAANQMDASTTQHAEQQDGFGSSGSCRLDPEVDTHNSCFVLPDLNLMPSEEQIDPQVVEDCQQFG